MPRSKARTNDWVKLANSVTVARDVLRAAFPHANVLKKVLETELKSAPRSSYTWVPTADLYQLLVQYADVGKRLTAALKEREHNERTTKNEND